MRIFTATDIDNCGKLVEYIHGAATQGGITPMSRVVVRIGSEGGPEYNIVAVKGRNTVFGNEMILELDKVPNPK